MTRALFRRCRRRCSAAATLSSPMASCSSSTPGPTPPEIAACHAQNAMIIFLMPFPGACFRRGRCRFLRLTMVRWRRPPLARGTFSALIQRPGVMASISPLMTAGGLPSPGRRLRPVDHRREKASPCRFLLDGGSPPLSASMLGAAMRDFNMHHFNARFI